MDELIGNLKKNIQLLDDYTRMLCEKNSLSSELELEIWKSKEDLKNKFDSFLNRVDFESSNKFDWSIIKLSISIIKIGNLPKVAKEILDITLELHYLLTQLRNENNLI